MNEAHKPTVTPASVQHKQIKSSSNINRQTIALASNVKLIRARSIASCVHHYNSIVCEFLKNLNFEQYAGRSASISISHILSFAFKLNVFILTFFGQRDKWNWMRKFRWKTNDTLHAVKFGTAKTVHCTDENEIHSIRWARTAHTYTHTHGYMDSAHQYQRGMRTAHKNFDVDKHRPYVNCLLVCCTELCRCVHARSV